MKFAVLALVALSWLYLLLYVNLLLVSGKGPERLATAKESLESAGHTWPLLAVMMFSLEFYGHQFRFTPAFYGTVVLSATLQAIGSANGWSGLRRLGTGLVLLAMLGLSLVLAYQAAPALGVPR